MPRPYSTDLRQRALLACERGGLSRARVAVMCGVGGTTLCRWQQQARTEGRRTAEPARGGPPRRLDGRVLDVLRTLAAEANASTLAEHADRLAERAGARASGSTLCRALERPVGPADIPLGDRARPDGLVRKKPFRAEERDRADLAQERAAWRAELAGPGRPRASGLPRRERVRHTADADACPGGEG